MGILSKEELEVVIPLSERELRDRRIKKPKKKKYLKYNLKFLKNEYKKRTGKTWKYEYGKDYNKYGELIPLSRKRLREVS
jgi:hypothetical protein